MTVKELVEWFEDVNPEMKVVTPWVAVIDNVPKSGYTEIENVTTDIIDGKPVCIIG